MPEYIYRGDGAEPAYFTVAMTTMVLVLRTSGGTVRVRCCSGGGGGDR